MRLIDLDDSAHNHMCYNGEYEIWSIDTEKEVEAIPIEWIKEVIHMAEKTGFTDYAYKLNVLLSDWAERKEE